MSDVAGTTASFDVVVIGPFNFPTLAEGLRVAALDVVAQRERRRRAA